MILNVWRSYFYAPWCAYEYPWASLHIRTRAAANPTAPFSSPARRGVVGRRILCETLQKPGGGVAGVAGWAGDGAPTPRGHRHAARVSRKPMAWYAKIANKPRVPQAPAPGVGKPHAAGLPATPYNTTKRLLGLKQRCRGKVTFQ